MTRLVAALLLLVLALPAWAAGLPEQRPVQVRPSMRVLEITDLDERTSIWSGALSVTLRWRDSRLAFDRVAAGTERRVAIGDEATELLRDIWHPAVAIANTAEPPRLRSRVLTIEYDGTVALTERMEVRIPIALALSDYPFDRQTLGLTLASTRYGEAAVAFRLDGGNPDTLNTDGLGLKNWTVGRGRLEVARVAAPDGGQGQALRLGLELSRDPFVPLTQTLLPFAAILFLPLICLMSVTATTPNLLFSALLATITLNFKIVLEQPVIGTTSNAIVDLLWLAYGYFGVCLMLVFTILKVEYKPAGGVQAELRAALRWAVPLCMVSLIGGRLALAMG